MTPSRTTNPALPQVRRSSAFWIALIAFLLVASASLVQAQTQWQVTADFDSTGATTGVANEGFFHDATSGSISFGPLGGPASGVATTTITAGDSVRWTISTDGSGSGNDNHSITSSDTLTTANSCSASASPFLNSGILAGGNTYTSGAFNSTGTFFYVCQFHCSPMIGEVIVRGAATHFVVSTVASATAGNSFSVTVSARDASGNISPGYKGTIHFTSSDGSAT